MKKVRKLIATVLVIAALAAVLAVPALAASSVSGTVLSETCTGSISLTYSNGSYGGYGETTYTAVAETIYVFVRYGYYTPGYEQYVGTSNSQTKPQASSVNTSAIGSENNIPARISGTHEVTKNYNTWHDTTLIVY